MAQANISIRIDEDVKRDAEILCDKIGLTLSAVTNVFYRQFIRTQGIPFHVSAVDTAPFKQSGSIILAKGRDALKKAREQAILNGTSEMSLEEINNLIDDVRRL